MTDKPETKINTFISSIRPEKNRLPMNELTARFEDSRRVNSGFMPFGDTPHGVDHMVELRIREWMRRSKNEEDGIISKKRAAGRNKITPP